MSNLAKNVMTANPQCCSAETPLNEVAKLMVECDCGEIPVVDSAKQLIGVVTDRDIVCRVVAKGKEHRDGQSRRRDDPAGDVRRRRPRWMKWSRRWKSTRSAACRLSMRTGCCCGIISQADVALVARKSETGEMVREVSRDSCH